MKIFKLSLILLLVVAVSCDYEDERLDFLDSTESRPGQFYAWDDADEDTVGVAEGSSVEIRVEAPIALTTDPTTVTIEVGGPAGSEFGSEVTVANATTLQGDTINEFSVSGNIITLTINNADTLVSIPFDLAVSVGRDDVADGAKYMTFTITSASRNGESLDVGRPDGSDLVQVVEIQDIDCGAARATYDVVGDVLVSDFGEGPFSNVEAVLSTNCPDGTQYAISDISGGLYGDPTSSYNAVYGASSRSTIITIDFSTGAVTWPTVSDQFGGNIVEDPAGAGSNYDSATGVITIYWTATAFGERGITTFTPQ